LNYDQSSYQAELDRIRERFTPLVILCREAGTAMRVGANHGSLSDRILSHYGDTPLGMVESAMEFVRICADNDYHDMVISMKASNTRVMIQAYRLLIEHMEAEGFNYPLHLGVTEAGDGDDARIKSALGIGSLLKDGFGDTIRVSLTEAPEAEIPVAKSIVRGLSQARNSDISSIDRLPINLFEYQRRDTQAISIFGGDLAPAVVADLSDESEELESRMLGAGHRYDIVSQNWQAGDTGADVLYFGSIVPDIKLSENTLVLCDSDLYNNSDMPLGVIPLFTLDTYLTSPVKHPLVNFVAVRSDVNVNDLPQDSDIIWVVDSTSSRRLAALRRFVFELINRGAKQPVVLRSSLTGLSREDLLLESSADLGSLFTDGLGDGIWLSSAKTSLAEATELAFGILQASRSRMTKTEYIACPSCGRTLFDLEEVTAQIRSRTAHLKGLKIGIMGCVVNGPGEMADADFGYVGTGPGKVSLYRGQMVVRPHVPQVEAVDSLIDLIKSEGYWVDP